MLEITIDTGPALETAKALERLPRRLTRNIAEVLREEARETARDARRLIRRRRGRASAPGEPPTRQSGDLARSIRFRPLRRDRLAWGVVSAVGKADGFYARFLEAGTRRGLEPRPFISAALDARRARISRRLAAAIETSLRTMERVGR